MDTSIERWLLGRENPLKRGQSVVFPDYAGYCISNVPALIETLLGANIQDGPLVDLGREFAGCERIVLLILDGFGYRKAQSLFREFPDCALKRLGESGRQVPLTSVYPSTTVSALTSLSTGLAPLAHGMIGYRLYLRETASITNMIRFTTVGNSRPDSAFSIGLAPETLIPHPTVHERLEQRGVCVHSVLPSYIATSGLSTALYCGSSKMHAAVSLPDMFVRTRSILRESSGKTLVSLYWPGLDSVAHVLGPDSESYRDEFRAVDDAVRRGMLGQLKNTLLLVTSDHGFVSMQPEDYVSLSQEFNTDRALLMPPVGEPRASYLFTRSGGASTVLERFAHARDDGLICLDAAELLDCGLLGIDGAHHEISNRVGDLAVLSTGSAGLYQEYPDAVLLRGMHGGLTEHEMLVPLIMAPL